MSVYLRESEKEKEREPAGCPTSNVFVAKKRIIFCIICVTLPSQTMMPYNLVALVSSNFSRPMKDTSYDVTKPIFDWKLKLRFLPS